MNSIPSSMFLRKRRFLTVLPLLICPFLVLFFWVLGGGSAAAAGRAFSRTEGGLNLALPNAKLKDDSHLTKMDYYRKADQDSAKRRTSAKNDPFYRLPGLAKGTDGLASDGAKVFTPADGNWATNSLSSTKRSGDSDRNEALVYRKLALLNATLSAKPPATPPAAMPPIMPSSSSPEVGRLETLVKSLHARDTTEDPELQQLSGLLDKLAALQQPGSAPVSSLGFNKLDTPAAVPNRILPVSPNSAILTAPQTSHTDLPPAVDSNQNDFYPAEEMATEMTGAIPAVVDQTVTVINGSTVSLRLQAAIRVKGWLIPAGTLVYGPIQLSGDRVTMTIHELQYQQQLFPVSLTVYGMDGLPGMAAPASVTRDVAKQSADASVQSVGLTPFDQSIGAQAANAGIQAAKTLLSRKVRLVIVTLPAGYQVLLKDNAQH